MQTAVSQLFAASRFKAKGFVAAPGIFLVGLGDRLVDPSCTTILAGQLDRPLLKHPVGGHDLPIDDSAWVIEKIKTALK